MLNKFKKILHRKKEIVVAGMYVLFIMYSALMIYEVFIGPYRSYSGMRRYNLYPFKTISMFLSNSNSYNFQILFINIVGNIVTFIPIGFFITALFKRCRKLINIALVCMFIIAFIELGQFTLNVGIFDIDDIILNTLGCICGFYFYKIVRRLFL